MSVRFLAAALVLTATSAFAQAASFDLQAGDRSVGQDVYKLEKAKQGYKLNSRLNTHINGSEASITNNFKLDENYRFVDGESSNIAAQMHNSYSPNKARTEIVIGSVQAGIQDSKHLPVKPNFVLLPAYDAGAAQVLLLEATAHPTDDNLYNVVVPAVANMGSQNSAGSGAAASLPQQVAGNFAYDALWAKGADATGTLEGKSVTVHSFTLTSGKNVWTFYADDANLLMQVNNSMVKASYVRAKFKLAAQ